jgi:hypothetical protein
VSTRPNDFLHQACDLARLGVPPRLELGIDQRAVHAHLELAIIRWNQGQCIDFWLVEFQKFGCQTGSAIRIVSDSAISNRDIEQHLTLRACPSLKKIITKFTRRARVKG